MTFLSPKRIMPKLITENFETNENYNEYQKRVLRAMKKRDVKTIKKLAQIIFNQKTLSTRNLNSIEKTLKDYLKQNAIDKRANYNDKSKQKASNCIEYNLSFRSEIVLAIAKALDVSLDYLLCSSNTMNTDINIREFCDQSLIDEKSYNTIKKRISFQHIDYELHELDRAVIFNLIMQNDEFYNYISSYMDLIRIQGLKNTKQNNKSIKDTKPIEESIGEEKYNNLLSIMEKSNFENYDDSKISIEDKKLINIIELEKIIESCNYEIDTGRDYLEDVYKYKLEEASRLLANSTLDRIQKYLNSK